MRTQSHLKKDHSDLELKVKELDCLFNISCLNEYQLSKDEILQKAVDYIPFGLQFPEIAGAAIEFNDKAYRTANYNETEWLLKSEISEPAENTLIIKAVYLEKPASIKEPFLGEEHKLLDAVTAILKQKLRHNTYINELRKMYESWDQAYDKAGIGHWEANLKDDTLYWSSAIKKLHEVPDDYEPDLQSAIGFYEEGVHRKAITNAVQRAIELGKPFEVELKIITAKGKERWIHALGESEFQNGKCIRIYGSTQNITKRKLAENNLKAQKERLERSQKIGKMGDWEFDAVNKEIIWSPMTYEIFERDPEKGAPDYDRIISFYFKKDRDTLERNIKKALNEEEPYDLMMQLQTDSGKSKYVRTIGIPISNNLGKVVKLLGIVQDLTEEKKTELALIESEAKLRATTNNIPGVVFRYILLPNGEDQVLYVSDKSKDIFGLTPKEIINNIDLIWDRIPKDDIKRLKKSIAKSAVKLSTWDQRWRFFKSNNDMRWLEGVGSPQKMDDGSYLWNTIILDITENVKLRDELKENEMRLDAAITGADLGVWDLNLKTGKNYTNARWWNMLGYDHNEIEFTYQSFLDLLHPEDKNKPAEVLKNLQTGNIDNLDLTLRLRGKDGIYRTILNRGKVVEFDEEGKIVRMIGTHMDVSEKIELMDKVVQSAIEGEDRERKRIASDLHDGIGQYLAASNMNFESVKQELGKLTNKSATRFKRGLKLLKKAMEETRKTAHKLMPEAIEDYGLTLAVESLLENLENSIGVNTGFESTVDESSLDKQTCINLYRIIQEATNNAVMHGQSSNITITLHQEEDKIACTIKDDGIGMNLDDPELEKGLGLQSMRFRVHSMLGTINFDSQPQKGMKITFDIPLNKSNMG